MKGEILMLQNIDGKIEKVYKVVIEKDYNHSLEKMWSALTEAEHVSKWMEYDVKIDLKRGGSFYINFTDGEPLDGIISTLEPLKKLYYTWGNGVITWELEEIGEKVKLKFAHNGLDEKWAAGVGSGWEAFIDNLGPFLSDKEFPKNRHMELMEVYEKMM